MPHNHNKCNSWMLQRQTNTKVVATYFILSAVRACLLNNLRSEAKGFKIANKRVLPFKKGNLFCMQCWWLVQGFNAGGFTGGWFKAMCSLMGIRHAKSVAYLSRSNGRAEVAGRQLFEKLRKIHITNPRRNWFEEMWPALKAHHDTPTPGGLSPHQILFGRDPLGRGLPLSGDGMAMDAKEFFARQEQTARDIRQQLEKEHAERQKSAPSSTAQKFRVGDPVWVIRPRPMGTHRTKTWFTPGEVVRRIGEDTYRIKVGHGQFRERHESQLRVREPDLRGQHVSLSYAAHEADSDDDYAEQNDYTVEKILAQRPEASAPGGLEFKVRWRGYGPSHDTWEPVSSFVPRVNTPFMEYIRKHKTKIHVSDLAALTRAIAARGA